jgi:hypothetical protein
VGTLLATACILLLLGGTLLYVQREVVNGSRFSAHLANALRDENVRSAFARRLTAAVESGHPALIGFRPAIQAAANRVVRAAPFQSALEAAAADVHRSLFKRHRASVTLKVAGTGALMVRLLRRTRPDLAGRIPASVESRTASLARLHRRASSIAQTLEQLARLGLPALVLAALALAGAVMLARPRLRAAMQAALAVFLAGAVGAAALAIGRVVVSDAVVGDRDRPAVRAVWDAFLAGLFTWCLVATAIGLVAAAGLWLLSRGRTAARGGRQRGFGIRVAGIG